MEAESREGGLTTRVCCLLGTHQCAQVPGSSHALARTCPSSSGLLRGGSDRMADRRRRSSGGLKAAAGAERSELQRQNTANKAEEAGLESLSLEEILRLYNQPINEEQAWAVCYQCSRTLAGGEMGRSSPSAAAGASAHTAGWKISGLGDVRILMDGSVRVEPQDNTGKNVLSCSDVANSTEYERALGVFVTQKCACISRRHGNA